MQMGGVLHPALNHSPQRREQINHITIRVNLNHKFIY